ncbi:hypothetical protein BHE74_00052198 [Ensete ventricosum]|nr:hypothetical protein GW17_00004448 [Ensete ventricosum]RWW42266.1 hypothetical protein BHE74_00052198 [Ensete ventricosum]RZS24293.1 hypothetical protein BHM03_00057341 [Ensete ventricosum]
MADGFTWLNAGRRKPVSKRGCSRGQGFPERRGESSAGWSSVSDEAVVLFAALDDARKVFEEKGRRAKAPGEEV